MSVGNVLNLKKSNAAVKNNNIKGIGMSRRLSLYWICTMVIVFAILMLVLSITGVMSNTSKELKETLELQEQNAKAQLSTHMDTLTAKGIALSQQISYKMSETLSANGADFDDLNNNVGLISDLEKALYASLYSTLQSSPCSGAFVVLDATCNTSVEIADSSRMGVYLRYSDLSNVGSADKHMVYFRGISDIARAEQMQMHNRWNLEMNSSLIPGYSEIINTSISRLAEHCYWTEDIDVTDTWEKAIFLCIPVIDSNGTVRGLCGMEISELYFRLSYQAVSSPYGDMLVLLAPDDMDNVNLGKSIQGGSNDIFLPNTGNMNIKTGKDFNIYSTNGETYIGVQQKSSGTTNDGTALTVITLVSEAKYQKKNTISRSIWICGSLTFLILTLAAAYVLSKRISTPITNILKSIQAGETEEVSRSGISEVDELVAFLQSRKKIESGGLPPHIEELLEAFTKNVQSLTQTERKILQDYIEGYSIEEIAEKEFISLNTARKHNTNINRKLSITSREELMLYIDLFRRCDKLKEIEYM